MKKRFLSSVALTSLSTLAVAADLPSRQPAVVPVAVQSSFDAFGSLALGYNSWDVNGQKPDGMSFDARGTFFAPLFGSLGFQADGTFSRSDFSASGTSLRRNTGSLAAHIFHRNSTGLVGVLVQGNANDSNFGSSRDYFVAAEAQYFLGNATLYGQIGYQNTNYSVVGQGVTADGWNIAAQIRYFVQSNLMIALKAGYADLSFDNAFGNGVNHSAWKIGAKTEYRFNASPVSVFAEVDYRDGRFKVAGVDMKENETRAMLGAKWNFGSQTLFQRDRNGASLDRMQSLLPPAIIGGQRQVETPPT